MRRAPSARPSASAALVAALAALVALVALVTACGSSGTTTIATPGSVGFTPKTAPPDDAVTAPGPSGTTAGTSSTTSLGKPTLTDNSTISTVGLDTVNFGMTVPEAEKAAGSKLIGDSSKTPSCYSVKPESGPDGVSFLVSDGRIERVDVTGGKVSTKSKIHVGSTNADVKAAYPGQIQEQPRPDGQAGVALIFVPKDEADAKFRLVFLTDGASVQLYRAGRVPQVLAASGCK